MDEIANETIIAHAFLRSPIEKNTTRSSLRAWFGSGHLGRGRFAISDLHRSTLERSAWSADSAGGGGDIFGRCVFLFGVGSFGVYFWLSLGWKSCLARKREWNGTSSVRTNHCWTMGRNGHSMPIIGADWRTIIYLLNTAHIFLPGMYAAHWFTAFWDIQILWARALKDIKSLKGHKVVVISWSTEGMDTLTWPLEIWETSAAPLSRLLQRVKTALLPAHQCHFEPYNGCKCRPSCKLENRSLGENPALLQMKSRPTYYSISSAAL